MGRNVVDSMVVTLGLDAKEYTKAVADAKRAQADLLKSSQDQMDLFEVHQKDMFEAAKSAAQKIVNTNKKTQKSEAEQAKERRKLAFEQKRQAREERRRKEEAERKDQEEADAEKKRFDGRIDRLKSLGLYIGAAILGFDSLKGAISAYNDTSNQLAQTGRFAPTVGTSVKEVQTLSNALAQVGGNAQDAQADLAKLAHAQFSYRLGSPDALAGWAMRAGIPLFGDKGEEKDKLAILRDVGKQIRAMTPDLQAQAMYAREMGLSEASIQLFVLDQADNREKILKKAEATAKADEKGAAAAQKLQESKANLSNTIQGAIQKLVGGTAEDVANVVDHVTALISGNVRNQHGADALRALGIPQYDAFTARKFAGAAPYEASFAAAEKKYGLPAGLLANVANQESGFNPNTRSKKGAVGLMQLMPQYFKGAGQDVNKDIDMAAAELSRLYKASEKLFGKDAALEIALASYNMGETAAMHVMMGDVDPKTGKPYATSAETRGYVPSVLTGSHVAFAAGAAMSPGSASTVNNGSATTNVDIGSINIHAPQARDANGIAKEIAPALQRKGVVAQANTGMN